MPQSSMNISLPEPLRTYVESRVESGAYSIPSEFVRDLIRRDREQEEIEQKLIEGLKSPAVPIDKNFWPNLRRIAHARTKAASHPAKPSGKR
jgi:antitoxin ParD1/3/4